MYRLVCTSAACIIDKLTLGSRFAFVALIVSSAASAFPRFSQISIFAALGCVSIYVAVLTVVIAVGVQDRPALAPPTGNFDVGYKLGEGKSNKVIRSLMSQQFCSGERRVHWRHDCMSRHLRVFIWSIGLHSHVRFGQRSTDFRLLTLRTQDC